MDQGNRDSIFEPIPLAVPDLSGREAEYLLECVRSNYVSSVGPYVPRFESAVAVSSGAARAVAVASGTAGLHLALICVGVRHNDLVIIPSFTFIATANAVAHCGAGPWLFDIDPASWTLDATQLEIKLHSETERRSEGLFHRPSGRRVAAIMPVYTLGTPADMDAIRRVARRYELPVVADAAAAIGATYRERPLAELADLTVFSFNGNKTVTSGGGGAIVGLDEQLLARAKHLSTQARVGADYLHDAVGYNYRMTNIQAAVGLAQIERLDELLARKRRIRSLYDEAFRDLLGIAPFPQPSWAKSACWLSGIVVRPESPASADSVQRTLRERGVSAGAFWRPVHHQQPYASSPCTQQMETDAVWPTLVILPSSTSLDIDAQHRIIAIVRDQMIAT